MKSDFFFKIKKNRPPTTKHTFGVTFPERDRIHPPLFIHKSHFYDTGGKTPTPKFKSDACFFCIFFNFSVFCVNIDT